MQGNEAITASQVSAMGDFVRRYPHVGCDRSDAAIT